MKTKHTAIPWKYRANVGPTKTVLLEKDGSTIAELSKSVRDHRLEANTAFIVEACNNYDRIKAANAEMLEALQSALAHWEENGDHFVPPIWVDLVRIIIAKAEGGESS